MRGSTLTIGVFCFKPVQQESVFINESDGLIRGILLQSWQESFFMVYMFYTNFNNISDTCISWRSVLLVKETGVPEENTDLPEVTDKSYHIQAALSGIRTHNISGDRHRLHW
jgi:hypothetical protein